MDKTYIKKDCQNCNGSGMVNMEDWSRYYQQNDLLYQPNVGSIACNKCRGKGYVDTKYFILEKGS